MDEKTKNYELFVEFIFKNKFLPSLNGETKREKKLAKWLKRKQKILKVDIDCLIQQFFSIKL